jgi:uncharacterized protein (TIGR03790 family)
VGERVLSTEPRRDIIGAANGHVGARWKSPGFDGLTGRAEADLSRSLRVGSRIAALVAALLLVPAPATVQPLPLAERVLVLVNDSVPREEGTAKQGASVFVGEYYAQRRGVPRQQILHLKTSLAERVTAAEYQDEIQRPIMRFLDANGDTMKRKILYLVPTYGVPVRVRFPKGVLAVDSLLAAMYSSAGPVVPQLPNPYAQSVGSRPPRFDAWSSQREAAGLWKMFIVSRLDGPSAMIAKGLVDKALAAESTLARDGGVAYFDYQGDRGPSEWQHAVDEEIRLASTLSAGQGFKTVLNVQKDKPCRAMIHPAGAFFYDKNTRAVHVSAIGSFAATSFTFRPITDGEVTIALKHVAVYNGGNQFYLILGTEDPATYLRLTYPLFPLGSGGDKITLEKVVKKTATDRAQLPQDPAQGEQINSLTELRIALRSSGVSVSRNGAVILTLAPTPALKISRISLGALCWTYLLRGVLVTDGAGTTVWNDSFATDTTDRYVWDLSPAGGLNALWVWGWYGPATDSYRFVPGAIGAQLTSYTANTIRTPADADPRVASFGTLRWGGNWVPRMLEEGVTATWGAVEEPYANFYAQGGNVFDHVWAGYNFGESFYIAQNTLNWVMTAIGDPLYAPRLSSVR